MSDRQPDPTRVRPVALTVTVVVLTYRRPQVLRENLPAVLDQVRMVEADPDGVWAVRVLVVDNDPDGSAASSLQDGAFPEVAVVVETEPGIAAARNRAVDESTATDLLVFIDDDERPAPDWLMSLLRTQQQFDAGLVRGRVVPEYEVEPDPWLLAGKFFERAHQPTGTATTAAPSGNLLLDLREVRRTGVRFDPRYGLTGGEDTLFTRTLHRHGVRMVWCAESVAVDRVPAVRLTRSWVLVRALSHGNTHSAIELELAGSRVGRARARVVGLLGGLVRMGAGGLRWTAGSLTRSVRLQATGARLAWRGSGMALGVLGLEYREYARGDRGVRRLGRRRG